MLLETQTLKQAFKSSFYCNIRIFASNKFNQYKILIIILSKRSISYYLTLPHEYFRYTIA